MSLIRLILLMALDVVYFDLQIKAMLSGALSTG